MKPNLCSKKTDFGCQSRLSIEWKIKLPIINCFTSSTFWYSQGNTIPAPLSQTIVRLPSKVSRCASSPNHNLPHRFGEQQTLSLHENPKKTALIVCLGHLLHI